MNEQEENYNFFTLMEVFWILKEKELVYLIVVVTLETKKKSSPFKLVNAYFQENFQTLLQKKLFQNGTYT